MKVSRVKEMQALDSRAIEEFGIADELLMENAGLAAYSVIRNNFGVKEKTFLIICGSGNNGGDGLVVARKILSGGGTPIISLLGKGSQFKGAAKTNFEIVSRLSVKVNRVQSMPSLLKELSQCTAVVDAIFGTGLTREVGGFYKEVIQAINMSGKPVFSIDIPSGINGDTGQVKGTAVQALATVTFGLPKVGNILYPGYSYCGNLSVSHISFPPDLYNNDSLKIELNEPAPLPQRDVNGHKGTFGDVLFIAGAASYLGAPFYSAYSFLKTGGGYSRLAAPASITQYIAKKGGEIVFVPQEETSSGSIALNNKNMLLEISEQVDMVVMGPGLSLNEETQELARQLTTEINKPLLIDGDGITAVAQKPELLKQRKQITILTPHPGEMARLSGQPIKKIEQDKIGCLEQQTRRLNSIIVLKGAHSIIGYPDGRILINMSGNSGMASAGSGDVLTGIIAAMYGLGQPLEQGVPTGVFIHGFSGDLAAVEKGEDGITAHDLIDFLPMAIKNYRETHGDIVNSYFPKIT